MLTGRKYIVELQREVASSNGLLGLIAWSKDMAERNQSGHVKDGANHKAKALRFFLN